MRKAKYFSGALILLVFSLIFLSACGAFGLETPQNLRFNYDVLEWNRVIGAEGYEIEFEGEDAIKVEGNITQYPIDKVGEIKVRVRAYKGETLKSKWSDFKELFLRRNIVMDDTYYYVDGGNVYLNVGNLEGIKEVVITVGEDKKTIANEESVRNTSVLVCPVSTNVEFSFVAIPEDETFYNQSTQNIIKFRYSTVVLPSVAGMSYEKASSDGLILSLGYDLENNFQGVCCDNLLIPSSQYTLLGQSIMIDRKYIMKIAGGTHQFSFYTLSGQSQSCNIQILDNRIPVFDDEASLVIYSTGSALNYTSPYNFGSAECTRVLMDSVPVKFTQQSDGTVKIRIPETSKAGEHEFTMHYTVNNDFNETVDNEMVFQAYLTFEQDIGEKAQYANKTYTYLGKTKNFIITNESEFKDIIDYSYIFRPFATDSEGLVNVIDCYMDINNISDTMVSSYIQKAFTEFPDMHGKISHSRKVLKNNILLYEYITNGRKEPTYSSTSHGGSAGLKKDADYKPHYTLNNKGHSFAIDGVMKTETVETTLELNFVTDAGLRPICKSGSMAEKIYKQARDILTKIIPENASQIEKAHIIYDYIVYNCSYDYDLANNELTNANELVSYENRSFFMEGFFLDRLAVCNGLAQAYSLMCNIEGIKAIKVNGSTDKERYYGHAWNKIYITDSSDGAEFANQWYIVDPTWGMKKITNSSTGVSVERLNHFYFMVNEDKIQRYEDAYMNYPKANGNYNYFAQNGYGSDTLYVETPAQLSALLDTVKSMGISRSEGLEILVLDFMEGGNIRTDYLSVLNKKYNSRKMSAEQVYIRSDSRIEYWVTLTGTAN